METWQNTAFKVQRHVSPAGESCLRQNVCVCAFVLKLTSVCTDVSTLTMYLFVRLLVRCDVGYTICLVLSLCVVPGYAKLILDLKHYQGHYVPQWLNEGWRIAKHFL
jgi:hypothetical protein